MQTMVETLLSELRTFLYHPFRCSFDLIMQEASTRSKANSNLSSLDSIAHPMPDAAAAAATAHLF